MKGPTYFNDQNEEATEPDMELPKLTRQDTPTPTSGGEETYKDSEAACDKDEKDEKDGTDEKDEKVVEDEDDDFERETDAKENEQLLKDFDRVEAVGGTGEEETGEI